MNSELVIREQTGAVVRLVLNDPQRFNALSDQMIAALSGQIALLSQETEMKVVVIAAAGQAFCAGHDLRQMQAVREDADGGRARWGW